MQPKRPEDRPAAACQIDAHGSEGLAGDGLGVGSKDPTGKGGVKHSRRPTLGNRCRCCIEPAIGGVQAAFEPFRTPTRIDNKNPRRPCWSAGGDMDGEGFEPPTPAV
jgi:hypothetical protein